MSVVLFDVRVAVRPVDDDALFLTTKPDAYFDITNIAMRDEREAIGYALQLSHDCFGLPFRMLFPRVIRTTPVIDVVL